MFYLTLSPCTLFAAAEPRRFYNIPRGDAADTLKHFAAESGTQLIYLLDTVRGVTTNAVNGELTAREALQRLIVDTVLVVRVDGKSGAMMVALSPSQVVAHRAKGSLAGLDRPNSVQISEKKKSFLTILAAWLAVAVSPVAVSADSSVATGTVQGRVFNAVTGSALANAKVGVDGTAHAVLTDETGSYRLSSVSAGPVQVVVSYLGMQPHSAALSVTAGDTLVRNFELFLGRADQQIVKLDAFSIVESREMSAQSLAMNEQRHAPNLKNVVAIDEFGDRGQENIGDFLTMLPGVSIVLSGLEPFEVSLRGLPSSASGLMIDGGDVASTRDERSPNLRAVPMANLSRVEVTKVPTPDVPANGLGGTINLISKAGFDAKRPVFSYQLYGLFHSSKGLTLKAGPRHHIPQNTFEWKQPSFDFNYTHPINNSFSVTVGGARTWRMVPMVPDNDENATWNIVDGIQRASQITSLVQLNKTLSGQVGIDWRIGKTDTLSLSYHRRRYELPITRSTMIVNYGAGVNGNANFSQGASTGVGSVSQGANWRVEGYTTEQFSARYRHSGPVWRFDANASFSGSGHFENDIEEGTFRNVNSILSNLVIRGEGLPASDGIMHRRFSALTRTRESIDPYDGGLYSIPSTTSSQLRRKAGVENIRLDLTRHFDAVVPMVLKVGVAANRTKSDLRTYAKTWDFRPNGSADVNARMARNFDVFDDEFLAGNVTVFGRPYRELSLKKLYELYQRQPTWFVLNQALEHQNQVTASREYTETISAAYLRSDVRLFNSRLWLVGGVRFERTGGEGRGPIDDINAQFQRDSAGNYLRNAAGQRIQITTDALALSKLRYQERAALSSRSYGDFYPSLNATFNVSEKLLVRGAYARTIGRPNVNFITPGVTITAPEVASPTITVSNTGLLPWTADNYDLSIEAYNIKDGVGSVGFFQKDIRNFFGTRRFAVTPELLAQYSVVDDGSFGNYEIATRENVGDARIRGIELGYRQSLTFLPQWARGLQVFVNYTKLNLGGSNAAEFSGFNPETMAAGVNFVRGRYLIKSTYSYQGESRGGGVAVSAANGIPPGTYTYQAKQTRWNINGEYTLTRRISVFCSVMDIGGFNFRTLRYAPNTPDYAKGLRIMRMGSFTTLGIKGRF